MLDVVVGEDAKTNAQSIHSYQRYIESIININNFPQDVFAAALVHVRMAY